MDKIPNNTLFCCPICEKPLRRDEKSSQCAAGHCFDIASGGYVHLLPTNQMNSKEPGDDKGMVAARSRFLAKGYYEPLRKELVRLCVQYSPNNVSLLDLGCGEGYYTCGVVQALDDAGKSPASAGIDISKAAVKLAAKKSKSTEFAVASVFRLPIAQHSMDLLLNCFSPLCLEEIDRVLKPGGYFLYVVPGAEHLWGLKCAIYDNPYPNEQKETQYDGFAYAEIAHVQSSIRLDCNEDIEHLFRMTPYFWKTSRADQDKLLTIDTLETPIAFDIHVYRKL